jgi:hypothetical protein
MEQPISRSAGGHLPWLIRREGRIAAGAVGIGFVVNVISNFT